MASHLERLIREHAERLDQLAGPIDLTEVTSAARHGVTTVELVDIKPGWTEPEGHHRWSVIAAAAAVVAIVVGGLVIATRSDSTGEVPADQPPTVAPNTAVAPRRETGVFEGADGGGPRVTYTVPDGWKNIGYGVTRDPTVAVIFLGAGDPHFTNFCRSEASGQISANPVGPTVQNLVSAWANLPGVDATAARNVTIDGFKGLEIEFTVPDYSEDCSGLYDRCAFDTSEPDEPVRCRSLVGRDSDIDTPYPREYQALPDHHEKVRVIDVDGRRLMIMARTSADASPQDRLAVDEILASIEIG